MKSKFKNSFASLITLIILLGNGDIFASGGETGVDNSLVIMLGISFFIIIISVWLILVYSEYNDVKGDLVLNPFKKMLNFLTKSTPIENEAEILLDHNYDGIKELDNRIPPWFAALFWGTIIFAFVYMIRFHIIGSGNVQEEEYREEMRLAKIEQQILIKSGALLNEESVTLLTDAASLNSGKEIFKKNCVSCHGPDAGGIVGPNLTDDYWIHGGGIKNIFKTIKYGVPSKGMISWQSQLSPNKIQEVASYVISLHGTNPPNGKAPQGEKYEPEIQEKES